MHRGLLPVLVSLWLAGCDGRDWRTNDVSEIMPPLDFNLVDENGEQVSEDAFLGKPTLLYFGYTHCPDICPTTLAELASITRQLDEKARDDIQILFVSVDPSRDTPKIMKRYTNAFGPQFVGLTGDKADIDSLTNQYRITYKYDEKDENGNYDVTHSSAVFAFDRQGNAQFVIRDADPRQDVVSDLDRLSESG
ncbi:SCO family protein [Halomonas sp. PR-M31]|uniref:SCO family protein n=1 Tax=Halomonas sp. PR-M31 TaxID=1471202 RepID=UPI000650CF57|nr:SCO family protein [Halomonas sp. PR-M31]